MEEQLGVADRKPMWQVDSDVCGTLQPQAIMTSLDEMAVDRSIWVVPRKIKSFVPYRDERLFCFSAILSVMRCDELFPE